MTAAGAVSLARKLVVVAATIGIAVIANLVLITLPIFLTVLARTRGFDESQSGLFAFMELSGIAAGSAFCALVPAVMARLGLRGPAAVGLVIVALANLLMVITTAPGPFLALAFAAGCGAGVANAVLYVILARVGGARSVGAFNASQLGFGALGIDVLTRAAAHFGGDSLFVIPALAAIAALTLVPLLPKADGSDAGASDEAGRSASISLGGWLMILALFVYFMGTGAVYSFLGYMGEAWGGRPDQVARAVETILLIAMLASLLVTVIGARFGILHMAALSLAGTLVGIVLLWWLQPVESFALIGGVFYFCVTLATSYLFEMLVAIDRSSGAAMMMSTSVQGGIAAGPAIAGYLVTADYGLFNAFGFALCALAAVMIAAVQYRHQRAIGVPQA